jgi:16S rRNA U516 pseudouridylate synthase RsuA-like enzyme
MAVKHSITEGRKREVARWIAKHGVATYSVIRHYKQQAIVKLAMQPATPERFKQIRALEDSVSADQ